MDGRIFAFDPNGFYLHIIDVSIPTQPRFVATNQLLLGTGKSDVDVAGDLIYIAQGGLQILRARERELPCSLFFLPLIRR